MKITILGDGAWGTAFASLLAHNGHEVVLWCANKTVAKSITTTHQNSLYLPGIELSPLIEATTSLQDALTSSIVFEAIPVAFMRQMLVQCLPFKKQLKEDTLWVSLSKGIEQKTLLFPTEIIRDIFGAQTQVAALSGPSFAREVAQKNPTIVTIAAGQLFTANTIKQLVSNNYFIATTSDDLTGVELSGAFKNIFALGTGLLNGAGFGSNTQVFFVLCCIEELKTLFKALGSKEETLYGPAGLGDIVLTSFSCQSRNVLLGKIIGEGRNRTQMLAQNTLTAEGLNTLPSICALAEKYQLALPFCNALFSVIFKNAPLENLLQVLQQEAPTGLF